MDSSHRSRVIVGKFETSGATVPSGMVREMTANEVETSRFVPVVIFPQLVQFLLQLVQLQLIASVILTDIFLHGGQGTGQETTNFVLTLASKSSACSMLLYEINPHLAC